MFSPSGTRGFGALESRLRSSPPARFHLSRRAATRSKEGAFYVIDLSPSDLMQNFDETGRVRSDFCKFVDFEDHETALLQRV